MNLLNVYTLRDNLVGDSSLIITAKNDAVLKRNIKGVMLSQQQNPFNTDTVDKAIYAVGSLDTDSGILTAYPQPKHIFNLEDVRLELVDEMNRKRDEILPSESLEVHDDVDGQKE